MNYALHVIRVLLTPVRHTPITHFPPLHSVALDTARWTAMVETARRVS